MEDIINRGGGTLLVALYNAISDDEWDEETPRSSFELTH